MGLLDNYTGIGMSPRPQWQHQFLLGDLLVNVASELPRSHFAVATEITLTDDWNDKAPDLVVFAARTMQPLVLVEITTHRELKRILRKCENLLPRFPAMEYWVFDYEAGQLWTLDADNRRWLLDDGTAGSAYLHRPMIDYFYCR